MQDMRPYKKYDIIYTPLSEPFFLHLINHCTRMADLENFVRDTTAMTCSVMKHNFMICVCFWKETEFSGLKLFVQSSQYCKFNEQNRQKQEFSTKLGKSFF